MYSDKKRTVWKVLGGIGALILIAIITGVLIFANARKDVSDETLRAIKASVEQTALECYIVEGAYPVSLAYMEEHYGLKINTGKYHVIYTVYASNVPPEIKVLSKNPKENE